MIRPLTSLRFVAAAMVVAHHYWGFKPGYAGVSFFFVLSGYVLTINHAGGVNTPAERRHFWWKRFARIYPLHLLTLIVSLPYSFNLIALPFNLALVQSFIPLSWIHFGLNSPSWSISDEAMFYALFPALLAYLKPAPLRKAAPWALAFAVLAFALAIVAPQPLHADPSHWAFYIFPPARLIEFVFGIVLGLLKPRIWGWRAELVATVVAAASLALVFLDLPASLSSAMIFWPGACATVLVFASSRGPIARLLSGQWLVRLGESSFALYMIHVPVAALVPARGWQHALLAIALSLMLHEYFEKPAQKALLKLGRRPRADAGPAAGAGMSAVVPLGDGHR